MQQQQAPGSGRQGSPRPRSSWPLLLLVCGLCAVLLYFAQAVFIPVALAILFALVLSSPVEALHRKTLAAQLERDPHISDIRGYYGRRG